MRIDDGHSTIITFSEEPNLRLYERSVTPPGFVGGGANDVTNMRNVKWRTKSLKKLKDLGNMTATVMYDTTVIDNIEAMINVNQEITIQWPDGATLTFWGWLDEFTWGEHAEGEAPTASVTIIPSNHNNGTPWVEVDPVYTPAGATT